MICVPSKAPILTLLRFDADGLVPNSRLPVLYCAKAVDFGETSLGDSREELAKLVKVNGWYVDWVDSIYRKTHFHSTTHEALIVFKGTGVIELGGRRGSMSMIRSGDMVIIPAGVGHRRIEFTPDFKVFGLYPKGQKWDLQWGWRKSYVSCIRRIAKVPLPEADPLFGKNYRLGVM